MQAAASAEKKGEKGERDEWVMEERSGLPAGSIGQREHLRVDRLFSWLRSIGGSVVIDVPSWYVCQIKVAAQNRMRRWTTTLTPTAR
jgi:hypothetical protein